MKKPKINKRSVNEKLMESHIDYLIKTFPKVKIDTIRFATTAEKNLIKTKIGGEFIIVSKLQGNKIKHHVYESSEHKKLVKRSKKINNH